MEQIAFIADHTFIYWNSIITVLASAVAVCVFLALWLARGEKVLAGFLVIPVAVGLSLVLSRLIYWYFRPENEMNLKNIIKLGMTGESALSGIFAGCFLAALLIRMIRVTDNLPALLDCLCLAGGAGIAVGRLAAFFDVSSRGMIMPAHLGLPWVCVVSNPVTGMEEYRLATFLLQAIVTGIITLVWLVFYLVGQDRLRNGDTALLFLQSYGAAQVILDSTRYDSLHFHSNGFVSVVQVLGALAVALAVIVYASRMVYAGGWKKWYPALWLPQLACFGLAGYMEYHVQRHGNEALFAYSVMGAALAMVLLLTFISRVQAIRMEKTRKQQMFSISGAEGNG